MVKPPFGGLLPEEYDSRAANRAGTRGLPSGVRRSAACRSRRRLSPPTSNRSAVLS